MGRAVVFTATISTTTANTIHCREREMSQLNWHCLNGSSSCNCFPIPHHNTIQRTNEKDSQLTLLKDKAGRQCSVSRRRRRTHPKSLLLIKTDESSGKTFRLCIIKDIVPGCLPLRRPSLRLICTRGPTTPAVPTNKAVVCLSWIRRRRRRLLCKCLQLLSVIKFPRLVFELFQAFKCAPSSSTVCVGVGGCSVVACKNVLINIGTNVSGISFFSHIIQLQFNYSPVPHSASAAPAPAADHHPHPSRQLSRQTALDPHRMSSVRVIC